MLTSLRFVKEHVSLGILDTVSVEIGWRGGGCFELSTVSACKYNVFISHRGLGGGGGPVMRSPLYLADCLFPSHTGDWGNRAPFLFSYPLVCKFYVLRYPAAAGQ